MGISFVAKRDVRIYIYRAPVSPTRNTSTLLIVITLATTTARYYRNESHIQADVHFDQPFKTHLLFYTRPLLYVIN